MIEAIHPITVDSDIYANWGVSQMRLDLPAYGSEYATWKQTVPADVQKIILDFMLARQIWKKGIHNLRDQKDTLIEDYYPEEAYHEVRQAVLGKTEAVTGILQDSGDLPPILAIGVDGSSLYRPHKQMDIDMWVLFDGTENIEMLEYLLSRKARSWKTHAREVSARPIFSHPITDCNGTMTNIHPFVMPHKVTYHSPSYPPSLHRTNIETLIGQTKQRKDDLYKTARLFTTVAKASLLKS